VKVSRARLVHKVAVLSRTPSQMLSRTPSQINVGRWPRKLFTFAKNCHSVSGFFTARACSTQESRFVGIAMGVGWDGGGANKRVRLVQLESARENQFKSPRFECHAFI